MTEESRGKRRKQANPKRSKVERVCSLGSEGEDEQGGVWSMEPQDCQGSPGLTPSHGTVDTASHCSSRSPPPLAPPTAPPHGLSGPGGRHPWALQTADPLGGGEDEGAIALLTPRDGEHQQGSIAYHTIPNKISLETHTHLQHSHLPLFPSPGKTTEFPCALEDLAHYEFLAQLRKATTSDATQNGGDSLYHRRQHSGGRHDELPPAIWSPGAQHRSTETLDGTDGVRGPHVSCPFCQRNYLQGPALTQHVRSCPEKHAAHMVCPLCGYTATCRAQMEQHLVLHNQVHDKNSIGSYQGPETRKFKCQQCGKAFKYKHHLKEHLRIHSGEKPYQCSNCKKRFSHSGSYSSHLSSKKCLSGGGGGGRGGGGGGGGGGGNMAEAAGIFNSLVKASHFLPIHHHHHQHHLHHSFPTSPPAGGERNSNGRHSPFSPSSSDSLVFPEPQQQQLLLLSPRDGPQKPSAFQRAGGFSRLWDPTAELRANGFKSTALLPYLQSGAKFEEVLQRMLHREGKRPREEGGEEEEQEEEEEDEEERDRAGGRGGGRGTGAAMEKKRRVTENGGGMAGEGRAVLGATCRWCLQLFPNAAVLLQHERYLCKVTRGASETPAGGPHGQGHASPPLLFSRASFPPADGRPADTSPRQKPPLRHAAPQQLLFPVQSSPTRPRPDALSPYSYWPGQPGLSPAPPISPSAPLPSPKARIRVPPAGSGSPLCLAAPCARPPGVSPPQHQTARHLKGSWPGGSQNDQPLDLSLPRQPSGGDAGGHTSNGKPAKEGRVEAEPQQRTILSPGRPLLHPHHLAFGGGGAPLFGYDGFSVLGPRAQAALALQGHTGLGSLPLGHPAHSADFLSPMAYVMERDTEAMLKRIHQDRHALVSEALSRGVLDHRSLGDEGPDGEAGPGRKRLRKTEEGLYACDICQKTFQKSSSLLRHKYEHTGKRPHECQICSKAFKHKHHLIEHSRLHSGEKPYQCDKCGKRFSHSGSYSQHMNHRYAYCSRDQEPDQDPDQDHDMPLTPDGTGTGSDFGARLAAGETPPSLDDSQTPHSFLSDSSLDGGHVGLMSREEEEE
ncbi:zinc finger E-box-binding homeobox 1-like, partial [Gadus chalcogrammus]|uniref:zinc finger E-box-binding homeobox 1-like n=1 Tax=Gadus chalcogrammus TaxID=1042646 RepID=UPI0024C4D32F